MQVNPIIDLGFKRYLRIPLKDKYTTGRVQNPTPMDKIFTLMSSEKAPLFIADDVYILDSSKRIKRKLEKENINYEELNNIQ